MLSFGPGVQVYLALGATDIRKSFYTLAGLVSEVIGQDPMSGHVFAFCNRDRDRMKILCWDQGGYCLFAKRLERGKFDWPRETSDARAMRMTHEELHELLSGAKIESKKARGWYDWHAPRRSARAQEKEGPQVQA